MHAEEIERGQRVLLAGAPDRGVYVVTPWRSDPVVETQVGGSGSVRLKPEDDSEMPATWRHPGELVPAPPARPVGEEWVGKRVSYPMPKSRTGRWTNAVLAVIVDQNGVERLVTNQNVYSGVTGTYLLLCPRSAECEVVS